MQFLKEQLSDFWQYFKMYQHSGSASSKTRFRKYIYLLVVSIVAFIMLSSHLTGPGHLSLNYPLACFIGIAIGVGYVSNTKPSLISVSPFSPKQKTVFGYLLSIVYLIIFTVFMIAVTMLFILIVALFAFLASGENIFVIEESIIQTSYRGDLIYCFLGLCYFFSVYTISHIGKRKIRNIAITIWFIVIETLMLVLVNVVSTASNGGIYPGFSFSADVLLDIDKLAHPWVPILIAGILSAVAFGTSVYTSYRCHRTRDF